MGYEKKSRVRFLGHVYPRQTCIATHVQVECFPGVSSPWPLTPGSIISPSHPHGHGIARCGLVVYFSAALAMASLLASASERTLPCLPFCSSVLVSLSVEAPGTCFSTDLPLGETQVHETATLSSETGLVLQGPAHRAGSNRQVAVVARTMSENQLSKMLFFGDTYVRPAAFQAAVILNGVEGGNGSIEGGENGFG